MEFKDEIFGGACYICLNSYTVLLYRLIKCRCLYQYIEAFRSLANEIRLKHAYSKLDF